MFAHVWGNCISLLFGKLFIASFVYTSEIVSSMLSRTCERLITRKINAQIK